MLTKIGVAALLGTLGTALLGGTASAREPRREVVAPVVVAAPVATVAYRGTPGVYYRNDRREDRRDRREDQERLQRERHEEALRHAAWLRQHHEGIGRGDRR